MGMTFRRMYKTAAMLTSLGCCTILLYFSVFHFNAFKYIERPGTDQVQGISQLQGIDEVQDFDETSWSPIYGENVQRKDIIDSESVQRKDIIDGENVQRKDKLLDDIFISVKTSGRFERTRLPFILQTWFQLAKNQTWFFTDAGNKFHRRFTNDHIVNTNCSDSHTIEDLCCKTSVEFDFFIESGKKWFCHFDDDNYVNVPRLVEVLQNYDHRQDWYLGRNSIPKPMKLALLQGNDLVEYSFWFATFGAGMCLSRSMALRIHPVVGNGKFRNICKSIHLPDDVTMGYAVEILAKRRLTVLPEFHSHLEKLSLIPPDTFRDQISFSYSEDNVVEVPGFNHKYDPSRFLSLHCYLFPHFEFCPR